MIADALSVDKSVVRSLADEIARNGSGFLLNMRFVEEPWETEDANAPS
jgi:hypothetical protein